MWPAAEAQAPRPLSGLRVLDFSTFLPGPYCTQMLADLGADVIKVEPPGGDPARELDDGIYEVANRNKRGILINLKTPDGQERCRSLAESADVVVEGFRPGVARRLGVHYESMRQSNPGVVYCSISGFGQTGPNRDRPGHDLTFLAMSGALSFAAHWGEPPRRSGVPIADLAAASHAAIAILAALRTRDRTGAGTYLDVAIADSAMAFASPRGGADLRSGTGNGGVAYPANDVFRAGDGRSIAVSAVEQKFWERMRAVLVEAEPALTDTRFDTPEGRRVHGDLLRSALVTAFGTRPAAHWIEVLSAVDVAVEPILSLPEAADSAHARARGIVHVANRERHVLFPVIADGRPLGQFDRPAPQIGQHDDEIAV
jgi:crotonobetainyl-CoA:carnitine CoA-transferase CaiB-like acyl-CoA transferase